MKENTPKPLLLVVAAVLVTQERHVLLTQRPAGKSMAGLWEFPGGKVQSEETPEQALRRELLEELGITAACEDLQPLTFASHSYENFHLLMPLYACRRWQGDPQPREGQTLVWIARHELGHYPMPPADDMILPVINRWLSDLSDSLF